MNGAEHTYRSDASPTCLGLESHLAGTGIPPAWDWRTTCLGLAYYLLGTGVLPYSVLAYSLLGTGVLPTRYWRKTCFFFPSLMLRTGVRPSSSYFSKRRPVPILMPSIRPDARPPDTCILNACVCQDTPSPLRSEYVPNG